MSAPDLLISGSNALFGAPELLFRRADAVINGATALIFSTELPGLSRERKRSAGRIGETEFLRHVRLQTGIGEHGNARL